MQVSHVNEHITHAVIGGGKTVEFGISNSAEFFNILSSTLYKNQILAVVRETLCNGWDIHIEGGIQDRPVLVTVDSEKFVIQDFGRGIHHDDMGPIYGTYGNSTKKHDGEQTGGFGLGCKSPFAYTDHFEVISCHKGVKTIYNISKSASQAMGKPGIIAIAQFPTTESGLTVTLRMKSPDDARKFRLYAQRIARNGDMNIHINGEQSDKLGMTNEDGKYMITTDGNLLDIRQCRVMLRYGNVIYPVESSEGIAHHYNQVVQHLNKLGRDSIYTIVFQAPPHSISVQPSREGLSMQEHTVNTLNNLFFNFLEQVEQKFEKECFDFTKEVIETACKEAKVAALLEDKPKLPFQKNVNRKNTLLDFKDQAFNFMLTQYPSSDTFRAKDIKQRLVCMVNEGLLDKGLAQSYIRYLPKENKAWNPNEGNWLQKHIIGPLATKMYAAGISIKNLYVHHSNDFGYEDAGTRRANMPSLVPADEAKSKSTIHSLPYLRNIIVLCTAKTKMISRKDRHKEFDELGRYDGYLFYQVSMKKHVREAEIAFFKSTKFNVVDLTETQSWEKAYINPNKPLPEKKIVKKGLVRLDSVLMKDKAYINTERYRLNDAPRIEDPAFVMTLPLKKSDSRRTLPFFYEQSASVMLVQLFGTKGGVAVNAVQEKIWLDKGIPSFNDYVVKQITDYILNSKAIREWYSFSAHHATDLYKDLKNDEWVDAVFENAELRKHFGIVDNRTAQDKLYMETYETITSYWRYQANVFQPVVDYLKSIPFNPIVGSVVLKIHQSKYIGLLSADVTSKFLNSKATKVEKDICIQIFTDLLNK